MRHICLSFLILFCFCSLTKAQTKDFVTGLREPRSLAFYGNDLYLTIEDASRANKIAKIDMTATTPTVTDVITLTNTVYSLAFLGNDLYVAVSDGFFGVNSKIYKIDVTATTPILTEVITGLNAPTSMAFHGNDLYVLLRGENKIAKIDVAATTPGLIEIITLPDSPNDIAVHDNNLYMSLPGIGANSTKILKVDVTATTPTLTEAITGLNYVGPLAFNGNDLYMGQPIVEDRVSKVDITATTAIVSDVVTGLSIPTSLAFYDNDLYISEIKQDKIIKVELSNANPPNYSVLFKDWDGTVLKTEIVSENASATAPIKPTRTGYTFIGWDLAFDKITTDLIVTAEYSINTFNVIFKDYDGTELKKEAVQFEKAATAPADPTRKGYTFTGWDLAFDKITADLTVTATYSIITSIEAYLASEIKFYPNPVQTDLTVELDNTPNLNIEEIAIFSLNGVIVHRFKVNSKQVKINIQNR